MPVLLAVSAVGLVAEPVPPGVAVLAVEAGDVLLGDDQVPLLHAPALLRLLPDARDHADVLVAHDARLRHLPVVGVDVGAADAHGLHLEQAVVRTDVGQVVLPELEDLRGYERRRHGFLGHHPLP